MYMDLISYIKQNRTLQSTELNASVELSVPLTLESANKSILLDHTISSTTVATCCSCNHLIAFNDVITFNLP